MDIRCTNCNKMFAELKQGNVLVTSSTEIEFVPEDDVQIEILCPRCKHKTTIIIK